MVILGGWVFLMSEVPLYQILSTFTCVHVQASVQMVNRLWREFSRKDEVFACAGRSNTSTGLQDVQPLSGGLLARLKGDIHYWPAQKDTSHVPATNLPTHP